MINFCGPASRKRTLQDDDGTPKRTASSGTVKPRIPEPSEEELATFYETLNGAKKKPAILKITPPYSKYFVPKLSQATFPQPITDLYNPSALEMDYMELLDECEKQFDLITVYSNVII